MNHLVQDILQCITSLYAAGKVIKLCWIPSHVGIGGNERADSAAKRAALTTAHRRLPLPAKDFFPCVHKYTRDDWQRQWSILANNKLKHIKPRLGAWASSLRKSRREEINLCRLRIGHSLASHRYLLCGDPRPKCPRCDDSLSIRHVLIECPQFALERARYFGMEASALTMFMLLNDDSYLVDKVLEYMKDINFQIIFTSQH